MDHFTLAIQAVTLMLAILGAVLIAQARRACPLPYLGSYLWYEVFLALDLLPLTLFGYFKINIAALAGQNPVPWLSLVDLLIGFGATAGIVGMLLATSRRIVQKELPTAGWIILSAVVTVFAFLHGIALTAETDYPLFLAQMWLGRLAWTSLAAAMTVTLIEVRKIPAGLQKRAISAFAILYLSGYLLLTLILIILPGSRVLLYALTVLYLAGIPLIWLPRFFDPAWRGSDLLAGNRAVLDKITTDHSLTAREREVMEMLLQGRSGKEIADGLFISVSTVKNHTYNLYRKLDIGSRHELYRLITANAGKNSRS